MKSNLNNQIIISNKKFDWYENQSIENLLNTTYEEILDKLSDSALLK